MEETIVVQEELKAGDRIVVFSPYGSPRYVGTVLNVSRRAVEYETVDHIMWGRKTSELAERDLVEKLTP